MENPFVPEPARIIRKYDLAEEVKFFQIRLLNREKALFLHYLPGQFMILSLLGVGEAPFSISSTPSRPGILEFCIKKVGSFTSELFKLRENSLVGLRGPYGNGFPVEKMRDHNLVIVVGGLGAAPLRSLLLYSLDNRDDFKDIHFLYGAKTPEDMLFRRELLELREREDLNCLLTVESDDKGDWPCYRGLVTDLFGYIGEINPKDTYTTVCGPPAMYRFVLKELVNLGVPKHQILMTLERKMRCGVGKCGHCAIEYIYTCLDGPVFTYWDVLHMRELV